MGEFIIAVFVITGVIVAALVFMVVVEIMFEDKPFDKDDEY